MEDVNNNRQKTTNCPSETVKVIVRCRPLSEKETSSGHLSIVKVHRSKGEIVVDRPFNSVCNKSNCERKSFVFDSVYDSRVCQTELYEEAFKPLVDSVLEGFNGTVFAYGQTGTGKTYTMEGVRDNEQFQGVIPQAFKHIFDHISKNPEKRYLVRASYLEIYQEEVKDLLSNSRSKKCALREQFKNGVTIKGLSSYFCSSINEINDIMTRGNKNRSVGATNMNEHSSRSHAIFTITIEVCETWKDGQEHIRMGKLNLVDLAGSERQGKAGTSGERLREATKINLSLSALGNVISSLVDGSSHIPYRDSKLTRLLQDSLGGNSRTVMVATIGPANYNCDETLNTLRYACRAKKITNKPRINEDPKDAILREYQDEINRLKSLLSLKQQSQSQDHLSTVSTSESRISTVCPTATDSEKSLVVTPEDYRDAEKDLFLEKIRLAEQKRVNDLVPLLQPYGLDPSTDPQQIMDELERRRDALMADDGIVNAEKTRILNELNKTTIQIKKTEEDCARLIEKINWLESKLLNSGKSLLEHTEEQEQLLKEQQTALKEQEEKEKMLRDELKAKELSTLELEDSLAEYKAKVDRKTAKLKKLKKLVRRAESQKFKILTEHENHITETEKMLRNITIAASPSPEKTQLFYSCGQEELLRQIHLPITKTNRNNIPNSVIKYEDFAIAENCIGEKSNTQCRVKILDESCGKLRGRRPNRGDLYAMPLYAGTTQSAFTQDLVIPEDDSLDELVEDELDEEGIDDLMESLNNIEQLNRIGSNELRKSMHTLSLDAIPPQPQTPETKKTKTKNKAPKQSASVGSIPKMNDPEYDPAEEDISESLSCSPDESGVIPEGCPPWKGNKDRDSRNPRDRDNREPRDRDTRDPRDRDTRDPRDRDTRDPRDRDTRDPRDRDTRESRDRDARESRDRDTREPRDRDTREPRDRDTREPQVRERDSPLYHRLRPSSATLAFELDQKACLENPSACEATPPTIRQNMLSPTEIQILSKRSINNLSCSQSSGKLYSRRICQKSTDNRRAQPRHLNQKREGSERVPPMAMEVYENLKHTSKKKNSKNCLDIPDNCLDTSSGYSCAGGSDIDEYMQNLCNGPRGLYKFNPK